MLVAVDGFHGTALGIDVHGGDAFGIDKDDFLTAQGVFVTVQNTERIMHILRKNREFLSAMKRSGDLFFAAILTVLAGFPDDQSLPAVHLQMEGLIHFGGHIGIAYIRIFVPGQPERDFLRLVPRVGHRIIQNARLCFSAKRQSVKTRGIVFGPGFRLQLPVWIFDILALDPRAQHEHRCHGGQNQERDKMVVCFLFHKLITPELSNLIYFRSGQSRSHSFYNRVYGR